MVKFLADEMKMAPPLRLVAFPLKSVLFSTASEMLSPDAKKTPPSPWKASFLTNRLSSFTTTTVGTFSPCSQTESRRCVLGMHRAYVDAKDAASLSKTVSPVLGEGRRRDRQTTDIVQNRRSQETSVFSKLRVFYGDAGSGHSQNAAGAVGVRIAQEGNGSQRDHRIRSDDQRSDGAVAQAAFADKDVRDLDRGIPVRASLRQLSRRRNRFDLMSKTGLPLHAMAIFSSATVDTVMLFSMRMVLLGEKLRVLNRIVPPG